MADLMKNKINMKEQEEIFSLIGRALKEKVECFVVGGTAMMFLGLKEVTKDIDIVFQERKDYETFKSSLINLGAKDTKAEIINPKKVSCILSLGNARFDLFLEHLIHFRLTGTIISRIREVHEFGNLIVKVVSPEDIILFKSMADREADKIDAAELAKKININWEIILGEAEEQTKDSEFFFSVFLYNFLIGIREDLKTEIPQEFLKRLKKISENALLEAEKRLKKR